MNLKFMSSWHIHCKMSFKHDTPRRFFFKVDASKCFNPTEQKLFCGFASRSVFCQHAWHSNSISNMRPPVPNSPDSRFLPAHFYINSSTKTFIKNTRGSIQWYNFFSKKPIEKIRFLSLKSRAKSLKIWKNIKKKKLTKKHKTKQPNFVYY